RSPKYHRSAPAPSPHHYCHCHLLPPLLLLSSSPSSSPSPSSLPPPLPKSPLRRATIATDVHGTALSPLRFSPLSRTFHPRHVHRSTQRIKTTDYHTLQEKKECFVGSIKDVHVSEATTSSERLLYGPVVSLYLVACTIQTNKDIIFEDQNVQRNNTTVPTTTGSMTVPTTISTTLWSTTSENFTEKTTTLQTDHISVFTGNSSVTTESIPSPTAIPLPTPTPNLISKTTDGNITVPSTQFTTISMGSTTMQMQSTTQCVLNVTYPSSTTASPNSTDSDINVTNPSTTVENISKMTTPIFNYILRDDTGVACVLANMTIRVNLRYTTKDFQVLESMLTVPTNATTTGICVEKTANMTLSWEEPVKGYNNKKNKITFNYSHDNSKFFLDSIFVDLHVQLKDELKEFNRGRKSDSLKYVINAFNNTSFLLSKKSHSEVLEKDDLLYVKSAACTSSRDVPPASMYRWLLNTRSIVQLLSLVLPLPIRLPFVNKPIVFSVVKFHRSGGFDDLSITFREDGNLFLKSYSFSLSKTYDT
ncbi:hypothetical protein ALC56_07250, partial [Trachymyrmex septentrionalis]